MPAPGKSEVADKTGATKAGPRPQLASATDNKTMKSKEEKKEGEKNTERGEDGMSATKKDGAGYQSTSHPYANSFRKVMADWMSFNFPDEAREKNAWPSELGKRRPKSAVKQGLGPSLVQYLGWLDSLEDRDEASANNTSTKRYWQKFCEQTQNKKMVASWMEFARDARTADGLFKFRPAFGHVNVDISPGGRLHPLISFPSAGEFRDKKKAALGRQDDDDADDADGSKEDEPYIQSLAYNEENPVAPTKRPRHDIQGENDDGSSEHTRFLAKKPRNEKTATPRPSSSRLNPMQPKEIQFAEQMPQLEQRLDEATGQSQQDHPLSRGHFNSEAEKRKDGEVQFDAMKEVKREYSP